VNITEEEGMLWWHAHSELDRTTVHGAIVVYPKLNTTYPFTMPHEEFILVLGEWWHQNIADLYEGTLNGADPAASDASIINGLPGSNRAACMPLCNETTSYPCNDDPTKVDPCSANGNYLLSTLIGKLIAHIFIMHHRQHCCIYVNYSMLSSEF
jgi:hypothetical protein